MDKICSCLIMLLKSELTGADIDSDLYSSLQEEDKKKLFNLAKTHNVIQMVTDVVVSKKLPLSHELSALCDKTMFSAVYIESLQEKALKKIDTLFGKNKIDYIPLKGSVLKYYYPSSWLRPLTDIDILVKNDDFVRAQNILLNDLKCTEDIVTSHDISFISPENVNIELHHRLFDTKDLYESNLSDIDAWDYASSKNNSCLYQLTDEFFLFYHISHMAKHFLHGGCGLRFFTDLWVLDKTFSVDIHDCSLLKDSNLCKFADCAYDLMNVWFGNGTYSDVLHSMESNILEGSLFVDFNQWASISYVKNGNRLKSLLSRIWVTKDDILQQFPSYKNHPNLTFFYQFRRWMKLFNFNFAKVKAKEAYTKMNIDTAGAEETKKLLENLGL